MQEKSFRSPYQNETQHGLQKRLWQMRTMPENPKRTLLYFIVTEAQITHQMRLGYILLLWEYNIHFQERQCHMIIRYVNLSLAIWNEKNYTEPDTRPKDTLDSQLKNIWNSTIAEDRILSFVIVHLIRLRLNTMTNQGNQKNNNSTIGIQIKNFKSSFFIFWNKLYKLSY